MAKYRKYTWRFKCSQCKYEWKHHIGYFRFDGLPKLRKCPNCSYEFFYKEDVPHMDTDAGDVIIVNTDDDEGK